MRNKKAKVIRKAIYGDKSTNRKGRKYYWTSGKVNVIADELRRKYQATKKIFANKELPKLKAAV